MSFCSNCGSNIIEGAKFCQKCGHSVLNLNCDVRPNRQEEFSGKVYKCPRCGEVLNSFVVNCPACGFELRGVKTVSAVRELSLKLEAIESRREYVAPKGLFANATSNAELSKTDEQKISLIKSFSIPNTKEDILEFMILATSNMDMDTYNSYESSLKSEKEITEAWFSKVNQAYEKAKHSFENDDCFVEIQELYDKCIGEIKKAKRKGVLPHVLILGWIPLLFIVLGFIEIFIVPKDEAKEIERLEGIVIEVQNEIDSGEYKLALKTADSIDYKRFDVNEEQKWDIQREHWVDKVLEAAKEKGIELDYTPTEDVDNANKEDTSTTSLSDDIDIIKNNLTEFKNTLNNIDDKTNTTDSDNTGD